MQPPDAEEPTPPAPLREPLSAVFVVRDEEDRLPAALHSVSWADEVVVLDTGSVDRTRDLAEGAGARVMTAPWEGYVTSKSRALGLAKNDWVLLLDADERVSSELRHEIERALASASGVSGYVMPRLSWFLGRPIRHGTWYPDEILRLVRRSAGARLQGGRVHERCVVDGPTGRLTSPLWHEPYRNLSHALVKAELYARLKALDLFERGERAGLISLLVRPPLEVLRSYLLKLGFRDGRPGLVAALLHGYAYFLRAAMLHEMTLGANDAAEIHAGDRRPREA